MAWEEAERLNRLVGNLLDMTRLEAGALRPRREPCDLQDAIGAAVAQATGALRGREVQSTPTEHDLLRVLVTHAGKVLTHAQLLRQVWGWAMPARPISCASTSRTWRKIEADPARPQRVVTAPKVGYRLRSEA